jgi:hypothetical protein
VETPARTPARPRAPSCPSQAFRNLLQTKVTLTNTKKSKTIWEDLYAASPVGHRCAYAALTSASRAVRLLTRAPAPMITVPFEQVDAFTTKPFAGNPAAVMRMPATGFLGDELLTKIAAENNLSEVSHVPTGPVDLCRERTGRCRGQLQSPHAFSADSILASCPWRY